MEINQNLNTNPVDLKSSGLSALQRAENKKVEEDVLKIAEARRVEQAEAKKAEATVDKEVDSEALSSAVAQINDHVQNVQRNLLFTVDELSGREVVTIRDAGSDEVIKQIPSEEALELAHRLIDYLPSDGVEVEAKAVKLFSDIA